MNIFRQGELIDSQPGTGNILTLEIFGNDAERLVDEGKILGTWFQQLKHGMQTHGWGERDKIHLWLKSIHAEPEEPTSHVSLELDGGGDLIFHFWRERFMEDPPAGALVYEDVSEVLLLDPEDHLGKIGVNSLRIYGAWILGRELQTPGWISQALG